MSRFIFIMLFIFSCAHYKNVIPGNQNHHEVRLNSRDSGDGIKDAITQAQYFCKKDNLLAEFGNQQSRYVGNIPEEEYIKKRNLLEDGIDCGAGPNPVSALCSIIGLVLLQQKASLEKNYLIEINFRCLQK